MKVIVLGVGAFWLPYILENVRSNLILPITNFYERKWTETGTDNLNSISHQKKVLALHIIY